MSWRPLSGLGVSVEGGGPVPDEAARLAVWLGAAPGGDVLVAPDTRPAAVAWAESGAMAITGAPGGPPELVAASLVDRLRAVGALVEALSARVGRPQRVQPLALLAERAAITGFGRRGSTSVGGTAHLLRAAGGWIALNLGRPDDMELLPAWLETGPAPSWTHVTELVAARPAAELAERAGLLGLPVAAVPAPGATDEQLESRCSRPGEEPFLAGEGGPTSGATTGPPLVVDMSSLWAGPMCSRLLAAAGARVVKVEGARRPDGARRGPPAFFDLLHGGKEAVTVDFDDPGDLAFLAALLRRADVVVEGSRPRVMERLGIDPARLAARGVVWIALTGYGRSGPWSNRVAFGDDAAAAGGLVQPGDPPRFVADAVADPASGLVAALAALAGLVSGRGAVVDVALREVAAWLAGDGSPAQGDVEWSGGPDAAVVVDGHRQAVLAPRAATAARPAPRFGEHDTALREELGVL